MSDDQKCPKCGGDVVLSCATVNTFEIDGEAQARLGIEWDSEDAIVEMTNGVSVGVHFCRQCHTFEDAWIEDYPGMVRGQEPKPDAGETETAEEQPVHDATKVTITIGVGPTAYQTIKDFSPTAQIVGVAGASLLFIVDGVLYAYNILGEIRASLGFSSHDARRWDAMGEAVDAESETRTMETT